MVVVVVRRFDSNNATVKIPRAYVSTIAARQLLGEILRSLIPPANCTF